MPPERYNSRNRREYVTSRLRLREYDYRLPGPYFITLCSQNRVAYFGHVSDSIMVASAAGNMVLQTWNRIPERYPNVVLDGFVVMPNHLHGIVRLDTAPDGTLIPNAPSLSDVVRWLKIQTTMKYGDGVRDEGWPRYRGKLWQPGFMEHVIRNEAELAQLRKYIESNPALWEDDTFHPDAKPPQTS